MHETISVILKNTMLGKHNPIQKSKCYIVTFTEVLE